MWRVVNAELGRTNRERLDFTDYIRDTDGQSFASKKLLLNALNEEFVTAASKCGAPAADIPRASAAMSVGLVASDTSLRLRLFTPAEVVEIVCCRIASKTSTDLYGVSASIIKVAVVPLASVISTLFNICIKQGIYPDALKKVRICPLYKGKGKRSDAKSYRPISLVPAFSKIIEVGLNDRLLEFMNKRNILTDRQYAYRPGRATADLVREVVWRVLSARETGLRVALLCCDLSRAFDTANHSLVADKLSFYGVRGPAVSILSSFMSKRTQVVTGEGGRVESSELENVMGVPQGSCLSNTLFSLLLNDLPGAIRDADIFMYADDVAAVVTAPTESQLERRLNTVVESLESWFRSNGLALNRDKTCFLNFRLNGGNPPHLKVTAGSTSLEQVQNTKLLGFQIDSSLVWDDHIESICAKLGRACFALRRLASTASRDVVRSCYYATVHSVLTYGVELWGRAADTERAFVMQKRAVRAIVGVSDDVSCRELFKELNIMPLPCEHIYQVAKFTHLNLDLFQRRGVNADRSNKHHHRLVTPQHKLRRSRLSVYIIGPSVYNRLPETIRDAASTASFTNRIRTWLLEGVFYSLDEFLELPEL